ncbi:helix-turn-helix domain-containing protein [Candidatus Phaeomarinobacter ectocarpi]|uniref:helix-turn-helix domain-containing protein n=1 Tax=Candidatus Phaeomarinibacter ectocarpi TaxID=1458461 RepID=UPI0009E07C13
MLPAPDQVTWHDIKAALGKRGLSFAALARKYNVTIVSFTRVKKQRAERPQRLIAEALGCHPSALWPDRYDQDGEPIDRRTKRSSPTTLSGDEAA